MYHFHLTFFYVLYKWNKLLKKKKMNYFDFCFVDEQTRLDTITDIEISYAQG